MTKPLTTATLRMLGTLNVVLGLGATGLCICALGMLQLQEQLRSTLPPSARNEATERMHAVTAELWLTYMPLGAVLGLLFALSGWWLHRGERRGRILAWGVVLATVGWFAAYTGFVLEHVDVARRALWEPFPGFTRGFLIASMIYGGVLLFAYPAFLLFALRRRFPEQAS